MIELPRAALRAGEIAEIAEFFSFGTNDLTQTALGLSRDDAGAFLNEYLKKGLIARDPFVSLDTDGVGELIAIASQRGRTWRGSRLNPFLPLMWPRLRFVLAVPRARRTTCFGTGGNRGESLINPYTVN